MLHRKILESIGKNLEYNDLSTFGIISKKSLFLLVPHIINYSVMKNAHMYFLKNKFGNVIKSSIFTFVGITRFVLYKNIKKLLLTYPKVNIVEYFNYKDEEQHSFTRKTIMDSTEHNLFNRNTGIIFCTDNINICIKTKKFISKKYLKSLNNNCTKFTLIIENCEIIDKLIDVCENIDEEKYIIEKLNIVYHIPDKYLKLLNILPNLKKIRFFQVIDKSQLSILNNKIINLEIHSINNVNNIVHNVNLNKFKFLEILKIEYLEYVNLDISKLNFLKYLTINSMMDAKIIFNTKIAYEKIDLFIISTVECYYELSNFDTVSLHLKSQRRQFIILSDVRYTKLFLVDVKLFEFCNTMIELELRNMSDYAFSDFPDSLEKITINNYFYLKRPGKFPKNLREIYIFNIDIYSKLPPTLSLFNTNLKFSYKFINYKEAWFHTLDCLKGKYTVRYMDENGYLCHILQYD